MNERDRLSGKRVLLGVTGSIAAYKSVDLLRRLLEQGATVRVAMTPHAARFVSPLTFEALSGKPVHCDAFKETERTVIGHIDVTDNLDLALIAPATANIIGKIAAGIGDDSLTSALLALDCPLFIAPAMNDRMYRNRLVQKNISTLTELGVKFIGPGTGELACGATGSGRLADAEWIISEISSSFAPRDLAGMTVLVTAGPTREAIDAVRFLSNPSTGKMGFALAEAARDRGANVILVSGPTALAPPRGVSMVPVVSAQDMRSAVLKQVDRCHVIIMAAAVSDFKPLNASDRKIGKREAPRVLELERTGDILRELGEKNGASLLVGFAAETDDMERSAMNKLKEKNLDLIVANDLLKTGAGFGTDTNAVVIFDRAGKKTELPLMRKTAIAARIMDDIAAILKQRAV